MSRMIDLPRLERPREKACHYGIETLSNLELLSIVIGSGTKDNSAMDIAYKILSDKNGLNNLGDMYPQDYLDYEGIGWVLAVKLTAIMEIAKRYNACQGENDEFEASPDYLFKRYINKLSNSNQEYVYLIVLDKKKKIVYEVNLYKGTKNRVSASFSDIIKGILSHDGRYFYLVHNHPGGTLIPSREDVTFTIGLIMETKKVGIQMLDHLIIARNGYYSFLEEQKHLINEAKGQ